MISSWIQRGYFDFSQEDQRHTPSQEMRDALCEGLGMAPHALSIAQYPVGPSFRHTYWWRLGHSSYSEMQFFMRIAQDYPVLSLGVSVEKGYASQYHGTERWMDRLSWHWPRFLGLADSILTHDIPQVSAELGRPVTLRLNVLEEGNRIAANSRAYSYVQGEWTIRHKGRGSVQAVRDTLAELDGMDEYWVNAYTAIDLSPSEADALSPAALAQRLLAFAQMWRRVHALNVVAVQATV